MLRWYCGDIDKTTLNKEVIVYGWVKKNRKLGSIIFLDIFDRFGTVQVVIPQEHASFQDILKLSKESVVKVIGNVRLRTSPNHELLNGEYEIELKTLEVISKSDNTPFVIEEECDALEETRLKYRYLDLRRKVIKDRIIFRSQVMQTFRNFLLTQKFIEVETPILCKPTPEGAKDYLVPTRNHKHNFYALPQSPQIFKQLLMVGGFDKYFQFAKCFRDEPLRSDRQPEFTQLDIECSFVDEQDIQTLIENLYVYLFKHLLNKELTIPFKRLDYNTAMQKYGIDKPDLRFDCSIQEANDVFVKTQFKVFQNAISNNQSIKYLCFPNKQLTKKDITILEKLAKDNKTKGLAWINVNNNNIIDGSIAKVIEPELIEKLLKLNNTHTCSLIFVADEEKICLKALGAVRAYAGTLLNLVNPHEYQFVWITNWPLYEYDEEAKRFMAAHHPFTSPTLETIATFDIDQMNAKARSYDIVLNGYEIGGGSIRINDPIIQKRMFNSLGLSDQETKEKFGYLLDAFRFGVPIHGGLALGIDRLIMILTQTNNIKDVICFPKNSNGIDLMLESPSTIELDDLKELGLEFNHNSK